MTSGSAVLQRSRFRPPRGAGALSAVSAERPREPDLQCARADLCRPVRPHDPGLAGGRHPWAVRRPDRAGHRGSRRHAQIDGFARRLGAGGARPDRRAGRTGTTGGRNCWNSPTRAAPSTRLSRRRPWPSRTSLLSVLSASEHKILIDADRTSSTGTRAGRSGRRRLRREALRLFPLVRRLPGADRASTSRASPTSRSPINLLKGEQTGPTPTRAVNPQGRVPALDIGGTVLIQSPAILEYLDEVYPEPPLLPTDAVQRAKVRAVCARDRMRHPSAQQFRALSPI